MTRRAPLLTLLALSALAGGCTRSLLRPDIDTSTLEDEVEINDADYLSKFTHPYGLKYVRVESVALVTGLSSTGSDPPPSPQRAALVEEMNREKVPSPNEVLASPETALVTVHGVLRPGIRKGDKFDIEVRTPTRTETTSLRSGWVLPSRMSEHAVLDSMVRSGHVMAIAEGAVLVDPSADGEEDVAAATRGRILGGGVALRERPMGLIISREYKSAWRAKAIAKAINLRFSTYRDGRKTGLATPKTDEFIELLLHDRYEQNITRFYRVVRSIALRESPGELQERLGRLRLQLTDPLTAATAAIRLEAIGDEQAIEILETGAKAADPEVRFYSAEALAYLDQTSGVEPLAEAARHEPAFRVNALAALSAMDDVVAYDALTSLLSVRSAETRYGAFRALWSMNRHDPLVQGEDMSGRFSYHILAVDSEPMVHVTRSFRPEVVLFGEGQEFQLPLVLDAGKHILVNGLTGSQITVSRFTAGEATQKRVVSASVDEVVRAIVELGGAYPDVVQALQQAKRDGALASSLRVDALPESGREYRRESSQGGEADDEAGDEPLELDEAGAAPYRVATPLPDLFNTESR